jgi:transcriptional regulator with XRE-family HTH domain
MIGAELKSIRKNLGLTQIEMAGQIGVTPSFLGLMERGVKPISARTIAAARAARPAALKKELETVDPMERIIEQALIDAGVKYLTDRGGRNDSRLDFELPDYDLAIEVKQFHSDRVGLQLARVPNVILAQGKPAVMALAAMIRAGGLSRLAG